MTGSGRWRAACGVMVLALVGCQASTSSSSERQNLRPLAGAWRPDLLFVRARPYPRLVVRVDSVEGCEPRAETLAALREFLVRHVDKPGGVEVVARPGVPLAEARGMRLDQLLVSTVDVPGDWDLVRQDTATIRVLFYDSRQLRGTSGEVLNPHSHGVPYPAQIYFDRAYEPDINRWMERALLEHEVGHVLGLVGAPERGDGAHCRNEGCLMRPEIAGSWWRRVVRRKQAAPVALCADCEADLARSRASTADARVRFVGPALVRDEEGYAVVSLPDGVFLCVGRVDGAAVGTLVRKERGLLESGGWDGEVSGWIVADGEGREAVRAALGRAEKDPYWTVRRIAAEARVKYDRGPSTRPVGG